MPNSIEGQKVVIVQPRPQPNLPEITIRGNAALYQVVFINANYSWKLLAELL